MRLVVKSGVAAGKEFEINRELVAGRAATADIVIGDNGVSSRHARLRPVADGIEVTDLDSTNGTFVDGVQIGAPTVVRPGQALRFSTTELAIAGAAPVAGATSVAASPRLVVLSGPESGKDVTLVEGQEVTIGRAPEAGLRLSDTRVSSRHASVRLSAKSLDVTDLGSANGTTINGASVTGVARAVDGSEIKVGDTVISFLASGQSAPPQLATVFGGRRDLSDSTIQRRVAAVITERTRKQTMLMSTIGVIAIGGVAFGAWAVLHGGGSTTPTDIGAAVVAKMGPATVRLEIETPDGNKYAGSGSIIDLGNGLVLTNNHVIADGAATITTIGPTGLQSPLPAMLVGTAVCDDLTVMKVANLKGAAPNMTQVTFADPKSLKQGESVVTLGYPADNTSGFNQSLSTTRGVISKTKTAFELDDSYPHLQDVIQIDAAINHGNSGGGLFDSNMQQVGVNTLT
ncbi:MAG: FHA domain-containing protein, partial [Tepidiformaceae bacterium]